MEIVQDLQLELQAKDKMLEKFYNVEQVEDKEGSTMQRRPYSTTDSQTMTKICSESDSSCSLSSHQDVDVSFGAFEKHTQGIGSKLLTKMGYDGKVLSINVQRMITPI